MLKKKFFQLWIKETNQIYRLILGSDSENFFILPTYVETLTHTHTAAREKKETNLPKPY